MLKHRTMLSLCTRQRASWTYLPQTFTSVHLFNKIVGSRFSISSPFFCNNWVKIHCCENKVGWRFTKLIFFLLGQGSFSNKQNDKTIKRPFVQIHRASNFTRWRFIIFKNKLGTDSPISKFKHLKIRRRDGVENLTTLEEGEFKVPIDALLH